MSEEKTEMSVEEGERILSQGPSGEKLEVSNKLTGEKVTGLGELSDLIEEAQADAVQVMRNIRLGVGHSIVQKAALIKPILDACKAVDTSVKGLTQISPARFSKVADSLLKTLVERVHVIVETTKVGRTALREEAAKTSVTSERFLRFLHILGSQIERNQDNDRDRTIGSS